MRQSRWVNAGLVAVSVVVAVVVCELVLRWRYAEPLREPSAEVLAVQEYLMLHPRLGFTWRPEVRAEDGVVFEVKDVEYEPLSTDAWGFVNAPEAIEERAGGARVDVVGVGDSFMEHGAHLFHGAFRDERLAYYNLAIHRQGPPQYSTVVEDYAVKVTPGWILLGLFENDFEETLDYDAWRESGLDWFAFHSGTWTGPPLRTGAAGRFTQRHLRGFEGLFRVLRSRLRGDRMSVAGPSERAIDRVTEELLRTKGLSEDAGAEFLLVLIPSRATAVEGPTVEAKAFDEVVARTGEVRVLDLRPIFIQHENPATLFYREDGHWNRLGMRLAADAMLDAITSMQEGAEE